MISEARYFILALMIIAPATFGAIAYWQLTIAAAITAWDDPATASCGPCISTMSFDSPSRPPIPRITRQHDQDGERTPAHDGEDQRHKRAKPQCPAPDRRCNQ